MKKFLTMPAKAFVAFAALTLLTGAAKSTPTPKDAGAKASECQQITKGDAEEKRNKLIRGMI